MGVAISIENAVKRFGKDTIINGLSLDINPGEFFTLLGPSGCGKTTPELHRTDGKGQYGLSAPFAGV